MAGIFKDVEKPKFSKLNFNKNKEKFFIIIALITYLVFQVKNIYEFSLIQRTVEVCVANGPILQNMLINEENIKPYNLTLKEYNRQLRQDISNNLRNNLILYKDKDAIIGKYSGYNKSDGDFLLRRQIKDAYQDNSRLILYSKPGKNIVELDITGSNLNTFKKLLKVGDKINIGCTYESEYQTNISIQEVYRKSSQALEVSTVVVKDLFVGVEVADILNAQGESLLDYQTYLDSLTQAQRIEIEGTNEYEKKMKVANLLLALTPEEEQEYREFKSKKGIKFIISLPQSDE